MKRFIIVMDEMVIMFSLTSKKHKKASPDNINCGVITLSDTITNWDNDLSGNYICTKINKHYRLSCRSLISDDNKKLLNKIEHFIDEGCDVIITTGGTGLSSRDITVETIESIFDKQLDGFGEIFRAKSYSDIGASAILSRATAGVYKKTLIFALPGSPNAVKLGLDIIIDELKHLAYHAQK